MMFIHDPVRTVNTPPDIEMRSAGRNRRAKPCVQSG